MVDTVFNIEEKQMIIKNPEAFELEDIFECGQCFRFNLNETGSYEGVACGKKLKLTKNDKDIVLENVTELDYHNIWKKYFDMDRDYVSIMEQLSEKDEIIREAVKYGKGIRILRQEPWETLISFIISQNNHIPRIKKCIEALSEKFGNKISDGVFAFPTFEQLADIKLSELESVKLGYRAEYILQTAKAVAKDGGKTFKASMEADNKELNEYLLSLKGVGPKVANCIMLFGYGRMDRFPIDVWIRRVMHELYEIRENDFKKMTCYAREKFGEYGGIAQQYLFYYHKNR